MLNPNLKHTEAEAHFFLSPGCELLRFSIVFSVQDNNCTGWWLKGSRLKTEHRCQTPKLMFDTEHRIVSTKTNSWVEQKLARAATADVSSPGGHTKAYRQKSCLCKNKQSYTHSDWRAHLRAVPSARHHESLFWIKVGRYYGGQLSDFLEADARKPPWVGSPSGAAGSFLAGLGWNVTSHVGRGPVL